ncbi:MAG: SDR family oxidoreductase [bacterium]
MELGLRGKAAIVTGGSSGLGLAISREFLREGCEVTICARGEERLERARGELEEAAGRDVLAIRADVSVAPDRERVVRETVERSGTVHILVNNAGASTTKDFLDVSLADWDATLGTILLAASEMCRLVIPHMQKQKWGRIINVGSTSSRQPRARRVISNAAKAALINFTKTLSGEFVGDGILVNALNPGRFATTWPGRIRKMAAESGRSEEEVHAEVTKDVAMGRLGAPEEFAAAAAFLASERASFITGAALQVDGGELYSI